MSKIDLIDKLHNLRDLLQLLELASQSLGMRQERNGMQRGVIAAEALLADITAAFEIEMEAAE
jgi:hypothetical protein